MLFFELFPAFVMLVSLLVFCGLVVMDRRARSEADLEKVDVDDGR